jgi:hypothetical protein
MYRGLSALGQSEMTLRSSSKDASRIRQRKAVRPERSIPVGRGPFAPGNDLTPTQRAAARRCCISMRRSWRSCRTRPAMRCSKPIPNGQRQYPPCPCRPSSFSAADRIFSALAVAAFRTGIVTLNGSGQPALHEAPFHASFGSSGSKLTEAFDDLTSAIPFRAWALGA